MTKKINFKILAIVLFLTGLMVITGIGSTGCTESKASKSLEDYPFIVQRLTQEFERRLIKHKINHGGNPILRFCADNVSVKMDPAGNLKPDKSTSQGKIDGIVSVLLALDRLMRTPPKHKIKLPTSI